MPAGSGDHRSTIDGRLLVDVVGCGPESIDATYRSMARVRSQCWCTRAPSASAMKIAPFVGVMSTHGDNTPCSLSLPSQAEAAKLGVAAAGGTPFEFTTISVSTGVGAVMAGAMTEADLASMELECSPTVGSCPGQFTAKTMAMVSETLGLAVPGSAMLTAVNSQRLARARRAGEIVLRILADGGPRPRDLVTRKSLENTCAAVAATGGSTNAALHLPAIVHEAGIRDERAARAQIALQYHHAARRMEGRRR